MLIHRYSRWDGTQEVFPLHEDDIMEELSEGLMSQGDVNAALRTLAQKGLKGRYGERLGGIQDLLQRLKQSRQQRLDRYDLGSIVENLQRKLDQIVVQERQGIQQRLEEARRRFQEAQDQTVQPDLPLETTRALLSRLEEMASKNTQFLDALPKDMAGAIQKLQSYEFMDPEAKRLFDELVQSLQRQIAQSLHKEISEHIQRLTPENLRRLKDMVKSVNDMLDEKLKGGQPDFQQFMRDFGDLFGSDSPKSLDELMERLHRSGQQMESLLNSLPQEMRQSLQDLLQSVLNDRELREELAALAANLEYLYPSREHQREYPFQGDESLTLAEAMDVMEDLQKLDELERQLKKTQQGGALGEVDEQALRELLGDEALQTLNNLKRLTDILEQAGYIRRTGARFEVTPKGMRRIGHKALQEIFAYIKRDRLGRHPMHQLKGRGGDQTDETKVYEFGDSFLMDLHGTMMNAVRKGEGVPVRIRPEDLQVYRTEQLTLSSTVLMLDLSLSMAMRGNFLAAKKVALALDNLIRSQFPRDAFFIVGFSTYAREVKPEKLPYLSWDEFDPYTNIQHGLALAQKLLSRIKGGTKQIIMISDGEPTAHIEGGQIFLQYPPSPRTVRETLQEVKRCTQKGIVINTFMLDRNSYLMEFVDQLTRINKGRVFYTTPERLGQYILVDYLASRRRRLLF